MKIKCQCGQKIELNEEARGQEFLCPTCGEVISVPTNQAKDWIENSPHRPWCEQSGDNIYSSGGECNCGRDAALKSIVIEPTLDQLINIAAQTLPPQWEINIEVQNGYGEVILIRDDGYTFHMHEDETTLAQQFVNALQMIKDADAKDKAI